MTSSLRISPNPYSQIREEDSHPMSAHHRQWLATVYEWRYIVKANSRTCLPKEFNFRCADLLTFIFCRMVRSGINYNHQDGFTFIKDGHSQEVVRYYFVKVPAFELIRSRIKDFLKICLLSTLDKVSITPNLADYDNIEKYNRPLSKLAF